MVFIEDFYQSIIFRVIPIQNQQFQPHIVPDCTVSLPMKINATFSGTVGMVKPAATNALPDWPTIVKLASVCGPIKYLNAETKVIERGRTPFSNILLTIFGEILFLQKLQMDSVAQHQVKCQMPDHSHDMLIQKIAANTTSA